MAKKKTKTDKPETVVQTEKDKEPKVVTETIETKKEAQTKKEEQTPSPDAELQDKYTRLLAEFDNYKKRTQKEKTQLRTDCTADVIAELLPVIDTMRLAVAVEVKDIEAQSVLSGMQAILRKFEDILTQIGVKPIEAVGAEFDPALHNAVMHTEDENYANNTVAEEFAIGYIYKDKVIRHSMVKVAN